MGDENGNDVEREKSRIGREFYLPIVLSCLFGITALTHIGFQTYFTYQSYIQSRSDSERQDNKGKLEGSLIEYGYREQLRESNEFFKRAYGEPNSVGGGE